MREERITLLVKKADFETYRTLKDKNIYPLVVETDNNAFDDNAYCKDGNLYKLKIQFLKSHYWTRARQNKSFAKDILEFENGNKFIILNPVEAFETENNKDGFVVDTPLVEDTFLSLENLLYHIGIGIKKENVEQSREKVRIYSEVADFHSYEIMRLNKTLPMVVILTEYEAKMASVLFDGLYTKSNTTPDGKSIMTLNLSLLNKMIIEGKIELEGIKFENGEVHKVDKIFGRDYGSLETLSVVEKEIDGIKYVKKFLENKTSNQSGTNGKE